MSARGDLFIVSSASGAGKSTLIRRLLADPVAGAGLFFSVSHTTRAPRVGEVDGRDYAFVGAEEFRRLREAGGFLESAEVYGNLYGTSRAAVDEKLLSGLDVLLDIDVQGMRQVREKRPEAVAIMVFPPSSGDLAERLRSRRTDADEVIARRLAAAARELSAYRLYDYAIINDDLEVAADELRSVVVSRRVLRARREARLEAILHTFAG